MTRSGPKPEAGDAAPEPAAAAAPEAPEWQQPRERRWRVLKRASILVGRTRSEIGCSIRNMSAEGAELIVPLDAAIPEEFLLYVPLEGIGYRARLRWRKQDHCGVSFSGTEPKPSWHYG